MADPYNPEDDPINQSAGYNASPEDDPINQTAGEYAPVASVLQVPQGPPVPQQRYAGPRIENFNVGDPRNTRAQAQAEEDAYNRRIGGLAGQGDRPFTPEEDKREAEYAQALRQPTFNASEKIRLAQLDQGMAWWDDQLAKGAVTQEDYQKGTSQLQMPAQVLKAKQVAAKLAQQQEQINQIHHKNAQTTAMSIEDAKARQKYADSVPWDAAGSKILYDDKGTPHQFHKPKAEPVDKNAAEDAYSVIARKAAAAIAGPKPAATDIAGTAKWHAEHDSTFEKLMGQKFPDTWGKAVKDREVAQAEADIAKIKDDHPLWFTGRPWNSLTATEQLKYDKAHETLRKYAGSDSTTLAAPPTQPVAPPAPPPMIVQKPKDGSDAAKALDELNRLTDNGRKPAATPEDRAKAKELIRRIQGG